MLSPHLLSPISHPLSASFVDPVDLAAYPDYLTKVGGRAMDLSTMWAKLASPDPRAGYTSLDAFRTDMNLIADNCEAFCRDRFPALPPVRGPTHTLWDVERGTWDVGRGTWDVGCGT